MLVNTPIPSLLFSELFARLLKLLTGTLQLVAQLLYTALQSGYSGHVGRVPLSLTC